MERRDSIESLKLSLQKRVICKVPQIGDEFVHQELTIGVEMLDEHQIFKLICTGCHNQDQISISTFGVKNTKTVLKSLVPIAMLLTNIEVDV